MATTATEQRPTAGAAIRVCTFAELEREGVRVVSTDERSVAVFHDGGSVYAVDNRCPHMGFPLHRGTVADGILTCHWHHARFDLAGGCTFDPFADDVASFNVDVRDGEVWLDPTPIEEDRREHWLRKADEGLEHNIRLVLAKAVIGLDGRDATQELTTRAALFGVRNRASGWSDGLSILTAMANVLPVLDEADRPKALFHALANVARATADNTTNFDLQPMGTTERGEERYVEWFRRFVDVRSSEASERTLTTAIGLGLGREATANMVFGACTDHLFLDVGHSLDFANKAFELLEHVGWGYAGEVLPSLIPGLVTAQRMEESSSWRHPVSLPELLDGVYADLDAHITMGSGHMRDDWSGHRDLAEQVLDGDAAETLDAMTGLVRDGVPLTELSAAVAYAASLRLVHFRVTNEFSDWNTVHHTSTYTNGVDRALRRAPSNLLARGIFDGAVSVYLERFLNVPKQPIPQPSGQRWTDDDLLETFDTQGRVDDTAQIMADLLHDGRREHVAALLGRALLREDAGFHSFQVYEAGISQSRNFPDRPEGDHILIGTARFLSAHSPTVRAVGQTFDIAARLQRGESLADE